MHDENLHKIEVQNCFPNKAIFLRQLLVINKFRIFEVATSN